jgi:hypothetical protein
VGPIINLLVHLIRIGGAETGLSTEMIDEIMKQQKTNLRRVPRHDFPL